MKKMAVAWTSLIIVACCPWSVLAAPEVSLQYVAGLEDRPYCDVSLETIYSQSTWEWEMIPLVRIFSEGQIAKMRVTNEAKVEHDTGWDKYNLNYTRFGEPEDSANLYNIGYEHKSTHPAWWNPGSTGAWIVRIKGEHKAYPEKPYRDYVSGEWELYSESKEPVNFIGLQENLWSKTFFDYAVNRALQGQDWFLDGWVLGEAILDNGGDFEYPWAESEDEISTKLISRASGGWSNHYRDSQYTWQVESYEIQWQQQMGRSSSFKAGYRMVDKCYPKKLTKSYYAREHLIRWLGRWDKHSLEAGATYDSQRYLAGESHEDYTLWITRTTRGKWPSSLKIQGQINAESGVEPDASVQASISLEFPKTKRWGATLRLGVEHDWDELVAKQTTARYALSTSRILTERCKATLTLEGQRKWKAGVPTDDWGVTLGVKVSL